MRTFALGLSWLVIRGAMAAPTATPSTAAGPPAETAAPPAKADPNNGNPGALPTENGTPTLMLSLDQPDGTPLTLDQSVRLAIESATTVLKAQNDVESNGAQALQGYAQFLPNLDAQATYNYAAGKYYFTQSVPTFVNGNTVGSAYTLTSTLNLFNGLSDFSALKSALQKKDAADLTLTRAKQQIALDVTQSFLQIVLDAQIVGFARKNYASSQAREQLLEEESLIGAKNLSDLFRQQAQTSADESLLLNSENKLRTDQVELLKKLRLDVAKKYHFIAPSSNDEKAVDQYQKDEPALITHALEKRVDLKASEDIADATKWDVWGGRGAYLPHLDLGFAVYGSGRHLTDQIVNGVNVVPATQSDVSDQLGNQVNYVVGLTLTWNIFDRLTTKAAIAKQAALAGNARIDAVDRRNQVEADVRQAFGDYQNAMAQLRSSKKGLEAAEKAYEVTEGRYEVGSASFIDLITAQAALLQAESARAQALVGFTLQTKTMEFALGETPTRL